MLMRRGGEECKSTTVVTAHDDTDNDDGRFALFFSFFLMLLIDGWLWSVVVDCKAGQKVGVETVEMWLLGGASRMARP